VNISADWRSLRWRKGTAGYARLPQASSELLAWDAEAVWPAPTTSAIREVPSEVLLDETDGMKAPCAVNLRGAATVPQQRLGRRVAHLGSRQMSEICAAVRFAFGCDLH
jgi:mRNA-degrading endonuclease toxin of MazEF toxin-antitoxin module